MNTRQHPQGELLGAYVLGILDPAEKLELEEHTAVCEACRTELADLKEMEAALGEVPPEMFLDGPPEDGGLMLQRTLRQVREEQATAWRRRSFTVGMGIAASAAALFFGGYLTGGSDSPSAHADVAGPPAVSQSPPQADIRVASAKDTGTKARMTVQLTPAVGWVRLNVKVDGVPVGERCRLVVVGENGEKQTAGSWVVAPDPKDASKGKDTSLDGSAAIAPDRVQSVVIENEQGKQYVSVPL